MTTPTEATRRLRTGNINTPISDAVPSSSPLHEPKQQFRPKRFRLAPCQIAGPPPKIQRKFPQCSMKCGGGPFTFVLPINVGAACQPAHRTASICLSGIDPGKESRRAGNRRPHSAAVQRLERAKQRNQGNGLQHCPESLADTRTINDDHVFWIDFRVGISTLSNGGEVESRSSPLSINPTEYDHALGIGTISGASRHGDRLN